MDSNHTNMVLQRKGKVILKVVLGTILVCLIYLAFSAFQVQQHINRAKSEIHQVASSDQQLTSQSAGQLLHNINYEISAAQRWSTGLVWWSASQIPYFGRTPNAIRTMVRNLNLMTGVTLDLEKKLTADRSNTFLQDYNFVPLLSDSLADLRAPIVSGSKDLSELKLSGVPRQVVEPVQKLKSYYSLLIPITTDANQINQIIPVLLGLDKPSKWMIVFQNTAEARSVGGYPGGWGILTATDGKLSLSSLYKRSALMNRLLTNYSDYVSPDQALLYGSDLSRMSDLNLSPDFPTNARLMAALEELNVGVPIDGVITMNEKALATLMRSTGPVDVGSKLITADSVEEYVTKGVYQDFPNPDDKDSAAFSIIEKTFVKFKTGAISPIQMLRAFIPAIYDQNIRIWAKNESLQNKIMQTSISGSMKDVENPTVAVVLINGAGNKIDAYVKAKITYNQGLCKPNFPYRSASMRVNLRNSAPTKGLPDYVAPRNGSGAAVPIKPGSTKMIIYVHVPFGSIFESAKIGNVSTPLAVQGVDMGRTVFRFNVELPAQSTQDLTVNYAEPAIDSENAPIVWKQIMTNPVTTKVIVGKPCN